MDFSADSIKIIQISEEKSFDFYTQSKDSICLSSYKMSFCAPNQLIFDNQTYSILKQERIIIDSGNHGFLLENNEEKPRKNLQRFSFLRNGCVSKMLKFENKFPISSSSHPSLTAQPFQR